MIVFQVNDMSCGRCVAALTRAIAGIDPAAGVEFDLPARRVRVRPQVATEQALQAAMAAAGYPASVLAESASPAAEPRRAGGCCGGARKAAGANAASARAGAGASCCG